MMNQVLCHRAHFSGDSLAKARRTKFSLIAFFILRSREFAHIAANRGDVGIALMACEEEEKQCSQNITVTRRIRTCMVDQIFPSPRFALPRCLQEVDKKWQLTHRRYFSLRIPFNMDSARKCLYRQRLRSARFRFTHWVHAFKLLLRAHGFDAYSFSATE